MSYYLKTKREGQIIMKVATELYSMDCIKAMGDEYFNKWKAMKDVYAEELDRGNIYKPIPFTNHNFSNHCFNIYKIISRHVFNHCNITNIFTQQEWFLLNTAVLLHDYSMVFPNFNRLEHSKESADYIKKQMDSDDNTTLKSNLLIEEADAVRLIVLAHSDIKSIKNGKEVIRQKTLENPDLTDQLDCGGASLVHVKFLAGILRLADEFDVTRSRIGNNNSSKELSEDDPIQKNSIEHWKKLKCFKRLERKGENLILIVDDEYIDADSADITNIKERIEDVVRKVRDQVDYVRKCVVQDNDEFLSIFPIQKIIIVSKELDDKFVSTINSEDRKTVKTKIPSLVASPLAKDIEERISDTITKNRLIKPGHYIVNEELCARDWIDLRDIITDKDICVEILDCMEKDMNNKIGTSAPTGKRVIVGIEENGMILGAQLAYRLNLPFTYLIAKNFRENESSEREKEVNFDTYSDIILVTDAIATFQTIGRTCEQYNITSKVERIYAILFREPSDAQQYHDSITLLEDKVFACNRSFKIEVFSRAACKFKECIAENL